MRTTTWLTDARIGQREERPGTWLLNLQVVLAAARALRFAARHATDHCGAFGDALVLAALVGNDMQLAFQDFMGHPAVIERGRTLDGRLYRRHTLTLDAVAGADQDLLASARLVATDFFNAFGSAEVRHVTSDGRVRVRYFPGEQNALRKFAEERGVEMTEESVPGE